MRTRPDIEAVAEEVFTALADPTRRAILAELAASGPATATDLAARLPITRQASRTPGPADDAGLVAAEPGERRRVRYRLRSAPMQVASSSSPRWPGTGTASSMPQGSSLDQGRNRSATTSPLRASALPNGWQIDDPKPIIGSGRVRSGRGARAAIGREKDHTRFGDELTRQRRELPWVHVEKDYRLDTPTARAARGSLRRPKPAPHLPLHVRPELRHRLSDQFVHRRQHQRPPPPPQRPRRDDAPRLEAPLQKLLSYKQHGWHPVGVLRRERLQLRSRLLDRRGGDRHGSNRTSPTCRRSSSATPARAAPTSPAIRRRARASAFVLEDGVVYQTYQTWWRGVEFLMGYYPILDRLRKAARRTMDSSSGSAMTSTTATDAGRLQGHGQRWCNGRRRRRLPLSPLSFYTSRRDFPLEGGVCPP